jgi:two-component system sensor histidine kinase KdpD
MNSGARMWADLRSYALAVVGVSSATGLFYLVREYFAKGQWALLYLLIIGLIAGLRGVRPALLAAVLAFLAWNYFLLPPFYTLRISDPKDWIALVVFLFVGVGVGVQTGRLREREANALSREREMALLNRFSARLVSEMSIPEMAEALAAEIDRVMGASCSVLFSVGGDGNLASVHTPMDSVPGISGPVEHVAAWVHREAKAVGLPRPKGPTGLEQDWPVTVGIEQTGVLEAPGGIWLPLLSTSGQEGVLYVGEPRQGGSYAASSAGVLVTAANEVAAFLERKRLQGIAVHASALEEADRLKSTLVSSVSHELKTPLASMTATVSGLLENDIEWDPDSVRRDLAALHDDLERLGASIESLVDLSRLESDAWAPTKDWFEFGEILGTALARIPPEQRERIVLDLPENVPIVCVDFAQWARVLRHLLENALVYGGPESPVRVAVSADLEKITVAVEDHGPGIRPDERERVFEKFYRGESSARVPSGTGLGLAIAREVVRFHGGHIHVEDVIPHGARFVVTLPIAPASGEESRGSA